MKTLEELNGLSQKDINLLFINAAYHCNIEEMTYLLTMRGLKKKAHIEAQKNEALRQACLNGKAPNQLEAVEFLLTSPLLKKHAVLTDNAFSSASGFGKTEVVKYLLTSPSLKQHADIHADDDYALYAACKYERLDLIDYYINELKIQVSRQWYEALPANIPGFNLDKTLKLIEAQNLSHSLDIVLEPKKTINRIKL